MRLATRLTISLAAAALAFPAAPASSSSTTLRAVPISTRGPSWYDADFHRRVLAAGRDGVRLTADQQQAVGMVSTGIRPGTWLISLASGDEIGFAWCTANFVFQKRKTFGLGTAGHCAAKDAIGGFEDVTAYVVPPAGQGAPGIYHIGEFVLSRDNGVGEDFAMVRIYPEYNGWLNPTMPVWGGPTGVYTSDAPTVVKHFGHGLVVGTGGTPRAGVAPIWTARKGDAFAWYGVGAPGDSGSAVNVVTGEGAGNFTHIVVLDGVPGEILPGMLAGTRLTHILEIARGWKLVPGSFVPTP